ncbi:MAG TPA: hypothetical protein VGZ47_22345 [Gemmataceae bacterium]|jgi:hypothetical protein|nr:hypothetical protein [Gemmataceae bacterium]
MANFCFILAAATRETTLERRELAMVEGTFGYSYDANLDIENDFKAGSDCRMQVTPRFNSAKALMVQSWRSPYFAGTVLAVVLVICIPIFMRLPLWLDSSLYDVAARNLQRGGVHYRDVFDTNLPGMVWLHLLIRSTCGWRSEALRAWDAGILTAIVLLLYSWLRRQETTLSSRLWFLVAVALFYPYLPEIDHCQRDPWMLLPALLATGIRMRQLQFAGVRTALQATGWAFLEGVVWGLAVWLKPHVIVPAFAVWLAGIPRILATSGWRRLLADAGGLMLGGIAAGIPGIIWLKASGAWPYFWDIFTHWNPDYFAEVRAKLPERYELTFYYLRPWSLLHFVALPLALVYLLSGLLLQQAQPTKSRRIVWLYVTTTDEKMRRERLVLAALYLGWMLQTLFLQKGLEYIHVPEVLLAMALLASQRWALGMAFLIWFLAVAAILSMEKKSQPVAEVSQWILRKNPEFHTYYFVVHPMLRNQRLRLWPRCCVERSNADLRVRLACTGHSHCGVDWPELERVAEFLRTIDPPLRDRELTCWHDSPHSLYLWLDLQPSTRFMHVATIVHIAGHQEDVRRELLASPQRYVVSDIERVIRRPEDAAAPGAGPLDLPPKFPLGQVQYFPWNQPIVFRAGRYAVHRVTNPIGPIDVPREAFLDPEDDNDHRNGGN